MGMFSAFVAALGTVAPRILPAARVTHVHMGAHVLELTTQWFGFMSQVERVPLEELEPRMEGNAVVLNDSHRVEMGGHAEWERPWWVEDLVRRVERRDSENDPTAEAAMAAMLAATTTKSHR